MTQTCYSTGRFTPRSARARFHREGSRLSQIRFRRGNALLDGETLRALHARERLVAVGVDLSGLGPDGMVGYRAKRHSG
jgi:dCTP deaminase